jgi:beta-N-acetylhexosaminidase
MQGKRSAALVAGLIVSLTACAETAPPARIVPPLVDASPTIAVSGTAWPVPTSVATSAATASTAPVTASPQPEPSVPTVTPQATTIPVVTAAPQTCALRTLDAMTEEQRIGQLFMIGLTDDQLSGPVRDAIAADHIGSVLFARRSSAGVSAVRRVSDAVQALATTNATGGAAFFIAANQEGGEVQALSGDGFSTIPSALDQGAMSTMQLSKEAAVWGRQLAAAGVNLDLAPVADVVPPGTDARNAPIGRYDREYAHDPAPAATHVAAFVAGMASSGVGTTAKHFPGLGRVAGNTDFTADVTDTLTTRHDPYLQPFAAAIAAGAPFVMISEATYQQIDPRRMAVFSSLVINDMLRGDLGFHGVVISDSLGSTAVAGMPPADRAIDFVGAGGDMIVLNQLDQAVAMIRALQSIAATDAGFHDRIDNAAWHVLRAKEAAGLLQCGA